MESQTMQFDPSLRPNFEPRTSNFQASFSSVRSSYKATNELRTNNDAVSQQTGKERHQTTNVYLLLKLDFKKLMTETQDQNGPVATPTKPLSKWFTHDEYK